MVYFWTCNSYKLNSVLVKIVGESQLEEVGGNR